MSEDNRPITKRSELVIPKCLKCGGRVDPCVSVPTRAVPGIRGVDLACHYGDVCRDCGNVENYN